MSLNKLFVSILIYYFFLASFGMHLKAQFFDDEFCGNKEFLNLDLRKKPWKGANKFLAEYLNKINYSESTDSIRYRVPITFWIYNNSDGNSEITDAKIKSLMDELNYYQCINKTGFRYYIRKIEKINKDKRTQLGYFWEAPWQTVFHKNKACINVYITKTIKKRIWGTSYEVRGTYNSLTRSVLIQYNTSTTGLSHEIGHYFGLLHPHRNYNKGKNKQESVSRTRSFNSLFKKGLICEKNGDGLADTPAEPKLSHLVDNNCNFIGTSLKDRWGDNYQSRTDNIMSYPTHYECRKKFTKGQKAVMLYSAAQNKYAAYWCSSKPENNIYCFDKYEPDNTLGMASLIDTGEVQKHTFHKVYTPNKKEEIYDTEDWLEYSVENARGKTLYVSVKQCGDVGNANINLAVFEQNIIINQITSNTKNIELNIPLKTNIKTNYFIRIKNETKPISKALNYKIIINII